MVRKPLVFAALSLAALMGTVASSSPATAQEKVDYPRLRAALHELREARNKLEEVGEIWPAGYKERALASTEAAINSVKEILAIKDFKDLRGVDRNPDFYKKYADHPKLRAALADLRDARDELRAAKADFGGRKEQALDDIDVAVGDLVVLLRARVKGKP